MTNDRLTMTKVPGAELRYDENGAPIIDAVTCGTCGRTWNDAAVSSMTPAPSGRCPFETEHVSVLDLLAGANFSDGDMIDTRELADAIEDLEETDADRLAVEALFEEISDFGGDDPADGVQLIADSYFEQYAREMAEDCGMIDNNATWPQTCIDWEQAARELCMDYTSVEIDGRTYWYR